MHDSPGHRLLLPAMLGALVYYAFLITAGGQALFFNEDLGLTYNSMALNLLVGRFDVDPAAIGSEAFIRDGRSYAYFGILPALLRLPVLAFPDLRGVSLTWPYTVLALTIGAGAHGWAWLTAMQAVPDGPVRQFLRTRLVASALLSGPPVMLAFTRSIYDESMAWAWAWAMLFVAVAMKGLVASDGFTGRRLAAMAFATTLCTLTRPSMAVGLMVGLALLMLVLLLREAHRPRALLATAFSARMLVPAAIVLLGLLAFGGLNYARWGDPFLLLDTRDQLLLNAENPGRLARLETYGQFNPSRIPLALVYYLLPIWLIPTSDGYVLQAEFLRLFDAAELPPTSFLLTEPLTTALAAGGVVFLLRRGIGALPALPAAAIAIGLCIPAALLLTWFFLAFRYRLEFHPLLAFLACLGVVGWAIRADAWPAPKQRRAAILFVTLFLLQCVSAHVHGVVYLLSSHGSAHYAARDGGVVGFYRRQWQDLIGAPAAD